MSTNNVKEMIKWLKKILLLIEMIKTSRSNYLF